MNKHRSEESNEAEDSLPLYDVIPYELQYGDPAADYRNLIQLLLPKESLKDTVYLIVGSLDKVEEWEGSHSDLPPEPGPQPDPDFRFFIMFYRGVPYFFRKIKAIDLRNQK